MTYYARENLLCAGCSHFKSCEEVDGALCVECETYVYPQFFGILDEEEKCEYFEPAEVEE